MPAKGHSLLQRSRPMLANVPQSFYTARVTNRLQEILSPSPLFPIPDI
jgi:hypothetical protein